MFKSKNRKKTWFFIIGLIGILICFFIWHNTSYTISYKIGDIAVTETYDSKNKLYRFLLKKENKEYIVQFEQKRIHSKKIIKKIDSLEENDTTCLIPSGKIIKFYPLCYQKEEEISYHQIENKDLLPAQYFKQIPENSKTYNNIEIGYLNNKKYFIWNYKGFYVIDEKTENNLKLLEEDTYNIPLAYKTSDSILIANYNDNYKFNQFYVIQGKNNKVKKIETKEELSFDSYIMGDFKNKVYFFDKKNKKEYEINLRKYSIENITNNGKGKIVENGAWQEISTNKLSSQEYYFSTEPLFCYEIQNEQLYLNIENHKIRISNLAVKDIIDIQGETVYYLVDDKLYYYNPSDGEVLIMSYFEWNFNYKNMIYIF